MQKFLWIVVIAGSLIGGSIAFFGVMLANGAPQEAAAAAVGLACAAIPYCLARAASEFKNQG
jgi:hypothetical protein